MRVAISTENGEVAHHFGRCPEYTILDIEDGKIIRQEVVSNPGHQPGVIPEFLNELKVDCVICGGMGPRAQSIFKELGIETIVGVSGSIGDVIDKLINGTLEGGESICDHGSIGRGGYGGGECHH